MYEENIAPLNNDHGFAVAAWADNGVMKPPAKIFMPPDSSSAPAAPAKLSPEEMARTNKQQAEKHALAKKQEAEEKEKRDATRAANLSFLEGKLSGSETEKRAVAEKFLERYSGNADLSDPQFADEVANLAEVSSDKSLTLDQVMKKSDEYHHKKWTELAKRKQPNSKSGPMR